MAELANTSWEIAVAAEHTHVAAAR